MSVTKKKKVINLADFLKQRGLLKEFQDKADMYEVMFALYREPSRAIARAFDWEVGSLWASAHIEWKMLLNTEAIIIYEPGSTFRLRRRKNDNSDNSRHTA